MKNAVSIFVTLLAVVGWGFGADKSSAPKSLPIPETVVVYYRAGKGREADLLKVLQKQWATLTGLHLVKARGHLLYRGEEESGGSVYVEIFTWKDGMTPDNPPPEILQLWNQMRPLVEGRGGHSGIEITGVKPVRTGN